MNLEKRFIECAEFLTHWLDFLALEPIRIYPTPLPAQIKNWITILETKSLDEIVTLENELILETDNVELKTFINQIKHLISFPKIERHDNSIAPNKAKKLTRKKKHEIEQILSVTHPFDELEILDIGGGAGHLSEILVNHHNRFSYCLDANKKFQTIGKKRIEKYSPENNSKIRFINTFFDGHFNQALPPQKKHKMIVGLHSCGELSSEVIRFYEKAKYDYLLNVGCCYQRLAMNYNLSLNTKKYHLTFTNNALNLASRCFALQTIKGLKQKMKVRTYRYGLHLYLQSLGHKEFIPTGKTLLKDYANSFGLYAHKYASEFNINVDQADTFYNREDIQKEISTIIFTDILRGLMGRVIETYIVLDRAIYLQEKNHDVTITEIFDRSLSPRNLAIMANRLN